MSARRSDGECAFGHLLTTHVGVVVFVAGVLLEQLIESRGDGVDIDFTEITREDIKDSKGEQINPPAVVFLHMDELIIK